MKNNILISTLLASIFLLQGCEGEGESTNSEQGWHFQGRDCLACHNIDLNKDKHLLYGGTLYKNENVENQDDLENVCGGEFVVNFLDSDFNKVYSSKNHIADGSRGYDAKGNLFILHRELAEISAQNYYVQITDTHGAVMAVTNGATHSFTSDDYDINNPADLTNRVSCNACHIKDGIQKPIFVQTNTHLCK